jgi:hypothetical protein
LLFYASILVLEVDVSFLLLYFSNLFPVIVSRLKYVDLIISYDSLLTAGLGPAHLDLGRPVLVNITDHIRSATGYRWHSPATFKVVCNKEFNRSDSLPDESFCSFMQA